jgi:rare lipoprotein A
MSSAGNRWTISDAGSRPGCRGSSSAQGVRPLLPVLLVLALWAFTGCAGRPVPPAGPPSGYPVGYVERGVASWYGPGFHGNKTSNGERYDMHQLTAAHRTLPLGSVVVVRSFSTGRSVTVRINDRGPFAKGRIIDLSYEAARSLGMIGPGTDQVELRVVGYEGRPGAAGYLRVQVGSFAELANAQALVRRLRARYDDARIVGVDLPEGRRYRVQVGEFITEAEAQVVAESLEAQYGVSPLVLRDDV